MLPPGHYTFTFPYAEDPYLLDVRGKAASAFITAQGARVGTTVDHSTLEVVEIAGEHFIRSLELKARDMAFDFRTPKAPEEAVGKTRVTAVKIQVAPNKSKNG